MRWTPRNQDGATSVLFVFALTGFILAAAMLAVDGGQLLSTRRGLVTDTDAAALAAAQTLAEARTCADAGALADAEAEARKALAENQSDGAGNPAGRPIFDEGAYSRVECLGAGLGVVHVATEVDTDLSFAGIFGLEFHPASRSSAAFGPKTGQGGVRPFGVCVQNPHYADEWLPFFEGHQDLTWYRSFGGVAEPSDLASHEVIQAEYQAQLGLGWQGVVHRVEMLYSNRGDPTCGEAPGQFRWIDFNANDNNNQRNTTIARWIRFGYPKDVTLPTIADPGDCAPDVEDRTKCPGAPGNRNDSKIRSAMDWLTCDEADANDCGAKIFPVVVFNDLAGDEYAHIQFVWMVLRGWQGFSAGDCEPIDNAALWPADNNCNFVDVEFLDTVTEGTIGVPDTDVAGPFGYQLCGVDHDDVAGSLTDLPTRCFTGS